ncbi:hypothetical protein Peur_049426 [Populus x canadensis]
MHCFCYLATVQPIDPSPLAIISITPTITETSLSSTQITNHVIFLFIDCQN